MKTYSEVANNLKAGLSKMETFEKLHTPEGKGRNLAEAISSFPSTQNYLAKQNVIQRFYRFLLTYFVLLLGQYVIGLGFQKNGPALAGVICLIAFCLFVFSFAKKGVMNAMLVMLAFPFIKTLQMAFQHLAVVTVKTDVVFSQAEVLMLNLSSAFFLYSLFSLIYGVKLFREIFAGERMIGRFKWDKEAQKPLFTEMTSEDATPLAPIN